MSADFPLKIDHYHQVYRNSRSLYEPHENKENEQVDDGAGFSMSNTMHAYMCYNGKKDKPQIFANLIRNAPAEEIKTMFADVSRFNG